MTTKDIQPQLTDTAIKILEKRYFVKDDNGKPIENASQMFRRVADYVASAEKKYGKSKEEIKKIADEFYGVMARLEALPNSPCLMSAGVEGRKKMLSACFVIPVTDSLEDIFDSIKNVAMIHKAGGGTGMDFSRLRGKNSKVGSTKGVSSGAISFMEVFDSATNVIKQGGLRKGANMGILRIDHPDIEEFITCKSDLKRLNNFNISVGITDKFIECVKKDKDFDLICPATKKAIKTVKAKHLWNKIVDCAWNSAEPGILFLDTVNKYNPLPEIDVIRASNPCVIGDTLILTEQGEMPIKDCIGQDVNIWNGFEWSVVIPQLTAKNQELVEVEFFSGQKIICTPYHKFHMDFKPIGGTKVIIEAKDLSISNETIQWIHPITKETISHKVKGVTKLDKREDVYCFTETKRHTAIFNGVLTGQCGEVPMSDWNSCNLMSINLAKFVSNNDVDYKRLGDIVKTTTRFLDNVIDVNEYPLQKITEMSLNSRSIGLGIMGLADMLAMLMIPYDSEQGRQKASEVFKFIHETSINTSRELAKEKGNFPFISKSVFKNERYMRNSTHTVVAPTGSISLFVDASSGCEPYFALAFNKNVMDGESFTCVNPYLEKTLNERGILDEQIKKDIAKTGSIQHIDKIPKDIKEVFSVSNEIDVKAHIAMQSELQRHCSLAISKTINLHKEATKEEVAEAYMYAHKMGCKGVTVYRDGCRQNQVLTVGVEKDNKKEEHNNEVITRGAVPERPECIECEIYNITVKGTPYVVLAGIKNGQLYEVFVDYALKSDGELRIPKNIEKGLICKVKRGRFDLQVQHEDGLQTTLIENIAGTFDSTAGTLTRMVSLALQSGATLERIVEQLSKSKDMVNFSKALMRVIKQFIKDGEIVTVGDTKCPECGANLRYESGCVSCSNKDCGWSKCS